MAYLSRREILGKLRDNVRDQRRDAGKHMIHYLFMTPFLVLFFIFVILPVISAMVISFTSFNMLETPVWMGVENYVNLFVNDDLFVRSILNTLVFATLIGPVGYALSLMMAWMISELKHGLRVLFTIIFYVPSLTGGMSVIWNYLFSGDMQGLLNTFLFRCGLITQPIQYLQDARYVVPILVVILLWMSLGTAFLSFVAGFQGVDKMYYEAAAIDGIRNRWQELWFVTLPLMKPQMLFGAVMSITAGFSVGDTISAIVGFPSVDYVAHTMTNHLQDYGTARFEMGYASAIATILFLMMLYSNKAIQRLIRKVGT